MGNCTSAGVVRAATPQSGGGGGGGGAERGGVWVGWGAGPRVGLGALAGTTDRFYPIAVIPQATFNYSIFFSKKSTEQNKPKKKSAL